VVGTAPVRIGIEAAIRQGWDAVIGSDGLFVGMSGFGASGPYKDLYRHFGITPERVADAAFTKLSAG
jgi:transketolase